MMTTRIPSPDLEAQHDEEIQYSRMKNEILEKYPEKPVNHAKTLPFHELFISLFDLLHANNKKPANAGRGGSRAKQGPHGPNNLTPHQRRDNIILRFMSRWRQDVGNDFFPALRLILPAQDKDRAMYGVKEKAIAKLIVKMLKINPKSDDANYLLNWKVPGKNRTIAMAGDFAGRCYEVLVQRATRSQVGDMRIAEVNALLDKLSAVSKENEQLAIFETFYNRMNADELMWLIRIILRQMKVGASEKTILDIWHPDGEALFNLTSSLRQVCWELTDPTIRLATGRGIEPMQAFFPQLAQFQMHSFERMVEKLGCNTPENPEFWIEEKLDGERLLLHMMKDDDDRKYPGGYRLGFWSRKGKDYAYLYGDSFEDKSSALSQHIKDAFDAGVENIILDGEMITWDPVSNTMVGFGTLKTAALSEKADPFDGTGVRPLFRVFDCLYLNGQDLTSFKLIDRRNALERCITDVEKRIEKHKYLRTSKVDDIDKELRRIVEEGSEGLVLKNPHSIYQLNHRSYDWIKVKPEYMTEYGESLDCVVIGAYFGQGHRGGGHASFLCGLRVDENHVNAGANPMQCYSFFKVGGGFKATDYARIKHLTQGKWHDWDKSKPPTEYIKLGGGDRQFERPDQWIKPCDSFVVDVKAASVGPSDQFATGYTLRFPRFKMVREDKSWENALSLYEFRELKQKVAADPNTKEFKVDSRRKVVKRLKKELVIAGNDTKVKTPYAGPKTELFEGLNFCVLTEMITPSKKTKGAIEEIIRSNGGNIYASASAAEDMLCVGEKRTIPVASLMKAGHKSVIKPAWLLDAIHQSEIDGPERSKFLIPFEPSHMFYIVDQYKETIEGNVDDYGDSYTRDVTPTELKRIMEDMVHIKNLEFDPMQFLTELEERGRGVGELPSEIFRRCVARFVVHPDIARSTESTDVFLARQHFLFGGGKVADHDDDQGITHFVIAAHDPGGRVANLRKMIARRGGRGPRFVGLAWLVESWDEKTLLDEESCVVMN